MSDLEAMRAERDAAVARTDEQAEAIRRLMDELAQAKQNSERLMRFAARILHASRQFMSDVDGGYVEAFGVEAGLLVPFVADGPCWEECECGAASDFPLTCYRYSPEAQAAIDALQAAQQKRQG